MCRVLRSVGGCAHSRASAYVCAACNLFACAKSSEPQNELCFVVFLVYECCFCFCFCFLFNSLQALSVVAAALMAVMVGLCAGLQVFSLRSTVYSLQYPSLQTSVSVPWQKITQFEMRGVG